MKEILVKHKRKSISIRRSSFIALLEKRRSIQNLKIYDQTLITGSITFSKLLDLANRGNFPYQMFFAETRHVKKQLNSSSSKKTNHTASKKGFSVATRGTLNFEDVEYIIDDLTGRQTWLKSYYPASKSKIVGIFKSKKMSGLSLAEKASLIRDYFDINLENFRSSSKTDALAYMVQRVESKNIFVSFSSHNYMPQNIPSSAEFSAFCIKDTQYPYIFINRRDDEQNPRPFESESRQTLSLMFAVACLAYGVYIANAKIVPTDKKQKELFALAQEIILPKKELESIKVSDLEDIKLLANKFKLTPKAIVQRLKDESLISPKLAANFFDKLTKEVSERKTTRPRPAKFLNGNMRYKGKSFSTKVLTAINDKKIVEAEGRRILFPGQKYSELDYESYKSKLTL